MLCRAARSQNAVSWYLRASISYELRYGTSEAAELLKKELRAVEAEMSKISLHIGSGLEQEISGSAEPNV
jgi:hypothetical protein